MMTGRYTYVGTSKGLGSTWKVDSTGTWVDCDQWSNVFNGACWDVTNPQLAGPGAPNPYAAVNPTTALLLGSSTGTGQSIGAANLLSGYIDPTNLVWIGLAVLGLILVIKR